MKRIKLQPKLKDCPAWWRQLIYNADRNSTTIVSIEQQIHDYFKTFHAEVVFDPKDDTVVTHIEFETPERLTWFLLSINTAE